MRKYELTKETKTLADGTVLHRIRASILGGLTDVVFHDSKDDAVKFYRRKAYSYFDGLILPKKTDVPNACGFSHRQFMVMSIRKFKRFFPEYKGGAKCHPKK